MLLDRKPLARGHSTHHRPQVALLGTRSLFEPPPHAVGRRRQLTVAPRPKLIRAEVALPAGRQDAYRIHNVRDEQVKAAEYQGKQRTPAKYLHKKTAQFPYIAVGSDGLAEADFGREREDRNAKVRTRAWVVEKESLAKVDDHNSCVGHPNVEA